MARDRRVQAVGAAAVLAGLFGTLTVALPGERRLHLGGGFARDQVTAYGPAHAALALSPVLTGLGLALARRPVQIVAATGVAGFLSAQLAGVGCVATRRWPLYWGCCAVRGVEHESLMTRLALLMGLGCAAVAVSCLLLLVQGGLLEWQRGTAVLAPAVALGVLEAIPWIMAGGEMASARRQHSPEPRPAPTQTRRRITHRHFAICRSRSKPRSANRSSGPVWKYAPRCGLRPSTCSG